MIELTGKINISRTLSGSANFGGGNISDEYLAQAIEKYLTEHPIDGGKDGREVEISNNGTYIQWRYVGESSWNNLVALADLKGDKGDKGDAGVSATHSWDGTTLTVTSASGTSSANLKGDKGDKGDTPTKGTDYFTEADKTEMVNAVLDKLNTENWTFTLEDGSTVTKAVYVG